MEKTLDNQPLEQLRRTQSDLLRPTWIEIDLDAVAHNIREVRRLATSREVCAVIKADGYGHGAVAIGSTLLANGADRFAVATADEALELRAAYPTTPILVLGEITDAAVRRLAEAGIAVALTSLRRAEEMNRLLADSAQPILVHLKLDTGMGRIGFEVGSCFAEAVDDVVAISELPKIRIEGIFSHFATADESDKTYTRLQLQRFVDFCDAIVSRGLPMPLRHISNSAGIIDLPEAHFDMVRAGIVLYGLPPSDEVDLDKIDLRPALTLKSRVVFAKTIDAGTTVGYGQLFRAEAPVCIATLPIGYADGIERSLSTRLSALHRGRRVPQRGRICMDQIMIEAPGAEVGDEVVLIGRQGEEEISIEAYAALFGTNTYEVICSMGSRIPRIYVHSGGGAPSHRSE